MTGIIVFYVMIAPTMKSSKPKLITDTRGSITTEYVILVGTVGLVVAAALFGLGPGLVANYEMTRSVIASP